jgi:N utilization substance protein B
MSDSRFAFREFRFRADRSSPAGGLRFPIIDRPAMSRRSRCREVCLQMLYQVDVNPDTKPDSVRSQVREQLPDTELADFCWQLFAGVMESRGLLDEKIEAVAENWTLKRMAPTDRNVLRLGSFELLFTPTPHKVVIDEAIELARKFGTSQSAQFVNGILDKLVPEEKRNQPMSSGDGD